MAETRLLRLVGLCSYALISTMFLSAAAQTCLNYQFSTNQVFASCSDLPYLNAFLHWTYDTATGKVRLAYRHASVDTSRWVAWAINPTSPVMPGAQALVAYQQPNGSMRAYTSPISGYQIAGLQEGALSFDVSDLSAVYANNEITIFATVTPPNSSTTVNQVWQDGPLSSGSPSVHSTSATANLQSKGTLNFASGQVSAGGGGGNSRLRKRNVHGVLNAVSWGTLMPLGAVIARYMRVFKSADPTWFYLHVACQSSAYIVGVAGWATGLKLGSDSPGITYNTHRTIGIVLFALGTLQVFALLLRPKKDHKYRVYWNVYHHMVGYVVIILSIVNIFKGFNILKLSNPDTKKWRNAYIGVIIAIGANALWLEPYTWYVVLKRKSSTSENGQKMEHHGNGVSNGNGAAIGSGYNNGYGARTHHGNV